MLAYYDWHDNFLLIADVGKTCSIVIIPKEISFRKVAQFKCLIKQLTCYFRRTVVFTAISLIQCASETSKFLRIKPTLMTCSSSCHSGYALSLYVFQDNKYHTPRCDTWHYILLLYFVLGQNL